MTDNRWKLVVNREGVMIAGDRFQLTATGGVAAGDDLLADDAAFEAMDSAQIEGIITELQSMTRRTYGQFCGLSHAAEMIGERWGMLIIRDLLVGPKRFSELCEGLPLLSPDILTSRLREMEHFGVVRAKSSPTEEGVVRYELTEYGMELEECMMAFGRWGSKSLDRPRPEEIVTINGLILAIRSAFSFDDAIWVQMTFEVKAGDLVVNGTIDHGNLTLLEGPNPEADLRMDTGVRLKDIFFGEMTPEEVRQDESIAVHGDPALLDRFVQVFSLMTR